MQEHKQGVRLVVLIVKPMAQQRHNSALLHLLTTQTLTLD